MQCDSLGSGTQGVAIAPNPCNTIKVNQTRQMRKIERLMNDAIKANKDFKLANTEVVACSNVSDVFLHGNLIARIGETWIELFDGGWQTVTTKSRLNAILAEHGVQGEHIFQKNFQWFVRTVQGVQPSDPDGFVTVPFFSGMRLN